MAHAAGDYSVTMSNSESPHLTQDAGDYATKDLGTFCMQLVNHSQRKSFRMPLCGSSVEIPLYSTIVKLFCIEKDKLDTDRMVYSTDRYAVSRSVKLPHGYNTTVLRIYTDEVHAGYVHLIREHDNTAVFLISLKPLGLEEKVHGPAVLRNIEISSIKNNTYSLSDSTANKIKWDGYLLSSLDLVDAVHCPYWPAEAEEWITRKRIRGIPSKSLIKQIASYGCDFVEVSHNRLGNNDEWRFSFSKAELLIMRSWTQSQMIVYETLWVLNKQMTSSILCSYYFKTLMFWACEEKPAQFWSHNSLFESACELLLHMLNCVKSKFCVNYFIPSNNMMDHLIDADLSHEVDSLWRTLQSYEHVFKVIFVCRVYELAFADVTCKIDSPAWIKRAFIINQRVNNGVDNYTNLFSKVSTDLQNALYIELADIYRGLYLHQKSAKCTHSNDKYIYFKTSESHLLLAVNLGKSHERTMAYNCGQEMAQDIRSNCIPCTAEDYNRLSSSVECDTRGMVATDKPKGLLYSRYLLRENVNTCEQVFSVRHICIASYCEANLKTYTDVQVRYYKEWPGFSPTVNISWFIAMAYLANLYYTTQRDVGLTVKTCNDIIDVYRQSNKNQEYADLIFPVVLSTQWTSIYDERIQGLLGFYSICSYVFDSSSRSVYLGVCPVQFALYLKLCTLLNHSFAVRTVLDDTRTSQTSNNNMDVYNTYMDDYSNHKLVCRGDPRVLNGSLTLKQALLGLLVIINTQRW